VAKQNKLKSTGNLRIIAGRWRGRKLNVLDVEGLRPTSDRIRETVFNWLQPTLGQAKCLDLFAGSGALGFEAASRGAESVTLVELNTKAAQQLQHNCQQLAADNCQPIHQDAMLFLSANREQYDIVFIDPPYQADLWSSIAQQLVLQHSLSANALIYLEYPSHITRPELPIHWQLMKEKKAGAVNYCLFQNRIEQTT